MKRKIGIERLYFLGQFKNIKVENVLELSEEVAMDNHAVRLLYKDLMLSCDLAYNDYKEYNERFKEEKVEDMLRALQEEKTRIEEEYNVRITEKETEENV